jgi:hypothetical protein
MTEPEHFASRPWTQAEDDKLRRLALTGLHDRRAPEAEPRVRLHAREKARYQAETDGAEGEGAIIKLMRSGRACGPPAQIRSARCRDGRTSKIQFNGGRRIANLHQLHAHPRPTVTLIAPIIPEGVFDVEVCDWREAR